MENITSLSIPSLIDGWQEFINEKTDPRTKDWFLVQPFSNLLLILTVYFVFCTKLGPRIMRDRKPFELKELLILYNALNVVFSVYILYEGLDSAWLRDYSFTCEPVDYSNTPQALRIARGVWLYFMVKLMELLDTIFFVLRKKNNQVSTLHMYHHTLMPVCAYIGTRFLPGGHGTLLGVINSLVHVVMYSYYLIAALGPAYQKYLWWKKYLTLMQLVQFAIIFVHQFQIFFRECNYPKSMVFLLCINDVFMIYMFSTFYIRSYMRKPKSA